MSLSLRRIGRQIGGLLPSVRTERRLRRLEQQVSRLSHFSMGSSAVYVGDNRVLVRIITRVHSLSFYVHADDKLLSPWLIVDGQYEPELTNFFTTHLRPDSHCIDVGTNFGYFTCLMTKYCERGRVLGIEPNANVHALAADNLLINNLIERGEVLNAAASDRAGELTLFRRIGRSGNTSVAQCGEAFTRAMREPPEEAFQIAAIRVDDLRHRLSGRVDFMKIDVEGAEPLAFAGARETIAANPQLQIVMEWSPSQVRHAGTDIAAFVADIRAAGLSPYLLGRKTLQPISHADLVELPYQPGVLLRRADS